MVAGEPVGSVWLAETSKEIILIDIALLPVLQRSRIWEPPCSRLSLRARESTPHADSSDRIEIEPWRLPPVRAFGFSVVDDSPMDFGMRREPAL